MDSSYKASLGAPLSRGSAVHSHHPSGQWLAFLVKATMNERITNVPLCNNCTNFTYAHANTIPSKMQHPHAHWLPLEALQHLQPSDQVFGKVSHKFENACSFHNPYKANNKPHSTSSRDHPIYPLGNRALIPLFYGQVTPRSSRATLAYPLNK